MRNFFSKYKLEIGIFAIALIARLIFFSFGFAHNDGDLIKTIKGDDGYYELSQNIIAGNGFSFDQVEPYRPNTLRPPVWPFMIAGIAGLFKTYWAVFIFEIILGSLIPVLGVYIARRLFEKRAIWLGTGILLALEPYAVFLSTVFYTETMFTFLFLIFFIFLIRYFETRSIRNLVWMSVFMGLATLVKPTIQYVPVVLPFIILWSYRGSINRKVFEHIGILIGVFMLIITPWLYRNYVEFGKVGMSAQPAFNLYVYLVPTVLSIDSGTNFRTEYESFVKKDGFDENEISLATADTYKDQALEVILEHKAALVKSVATTFVTFFTHDGMLTFLAYAGKTIENRLDKPALAILLENPLKLFSIISSYAQSGAITIILMRLFWIVVTLFSFVGVWMYLRREKITPAILSAIFLVAYFALTTSINGLGVNARFRVPVNLFIFAFALYGFLVTWNGVRSKLEKHA
jgi:4-amino-4-deoxy-L-arabinose transferase-like glycosyltransferase